MFFARTEKKNRRKRKGGSECTFRANIRTTVGAQRWSEAQRRTAEKMTPAVSCSSIVGGLIISGCGTTPRRLIKVPAEDSLRSGSDGGTVHAPLTAVCVTNIPRRNNEGLRSAV